MFLEQLEWLRTRLQDDDSSKTTYDPSSPEIYEAVVKSSFYCLPLELRRKILILAFEKITLFISGSWTPTVNKIRFSVTASLEL